jgi:hypothetical protein
VGVLLLSVRPHYSTTSFQGKCTARPVTHARGCTPTFPPPVAGSSLPQCGPPFYSLSLSVHTCRPTPSACPHAPPPCAGSQWSPAPGASMSRDRLHTLVLQFLSLSLLSSWSTWFAGTVDLLTAVPLHSLPLVCLRSVALFLLTTHPHPPGCSGCASPLLFLVPPSTARKHPLPSLARAAAPAGRAAAPTWPLAASRQRERRDTRLPWRRAARRAAGAPARGWE